MNIPAPGASEDGTFSRVAESTRGACLGREIPRVLVWTWASPFVPSGSPAILAELLKRAPLGQTEVVSERRIHGLYARRDEILHPVTELNLLRLFWPFRRGSLPQRVSRVLAFPLLVMYGVWRVWRFRPACIFTVYYNSQWILSSYLLSKLTGTPVMYYVHDPYLEAACFRGGLNAHLARWLEPRSLRHGTVLVLYESLRTHYRQRYGIESTVVRHLASHTQEITNDQAATRNSRKFVIGFAGGIYDNNCQLLKQLIAECGQDDRFEIRLWTDASPATVREIGADSPWVSVSFEAVCDRLLEALSRCDLLYLPLAFGNTPSLPVAALQYVLPTKAVDYLLVGKPILVHCPADYETAIFFRTFQAGHCLNEDAAGSVLSWLRNWTTDKIPPISPSARRHAIDQFNAERNSALLFERVCDVVRTSVH